MVHTACIFTKKIWGNRFQTRFAPLRILDRILYFIKDRSNWVVQCELEWKAEGCWQWKTFHYAIILFYSRVTQIRQDKLKHKKTCLAVVKNRSREEHIFWDQKHFMKPVQRKYKSRSYLDLIFLSKQKWEFFRIFLPEP